jgi:shikimate kinase
VADALRSVVAVIKVVVLLGPPGSGKSTIAEHLSRRGLRWRDWESIIVQRWSSRENFIANKAEALPALHEEILEWIESERAVAVFETSGLSDAPLLSILESDGHALVVRLDVSEAEALRRVQDREKGRHLTDEVEANRVVWRAFREHVLPRPVDLIIDTQVQSADSSAGTIVRHLGA